MEEKLLLEKLIQNKELNLLLSGYLNIKYKNLCTHTAYWRDKNFVDKSKNIKGFLGGKGEPDEIANEVTRQLDLQENDLKPKSNNELYLWMERKKIGVDCSGLVFAVLKLLAKIKGDDDWENRIVATPGGNPNNEKRFRTSAKTLCSLDNSRQVLPGGKFAIGDLIRIKNGKHVMIILGELKNIVYYIHSSSMTEVKGVHLGEFSVDLSNSVKWIFEWKEKLNNGKNLSTIMDWNNGDGVYRIKNW